MSLASKSLASKCGAVALVGALLAGSTLVRAAYALDTYIGYRVTKTIQLPGKKPDWDHISVDPENRNVFIGRADQGSPSTISMPARSNRSPRPKAPTASPSFPSSGSA
jgi:hypothetical protein